MTQDAADLAAIKAEIEALDLTLQQQVGPDGFIDLYVMTPSAWHRLLGFARGVQVAVPS